VIDFHCHLDLYPDPGHIARESAKRGVYVLSVTTTPSAWSGTVALAGQSPRIRTALGLHPQLAHQRKSELALFERLLTETRYVGEVGLDGAPEFRPHWADQIMVFGRVLELCEKAGGRTLSIHSRRATSPVLDQLAVKRGAGTPILHWFSGTAGELDRAMALGCWFSVGPAMLATAKGRALTAKMPRERLLTETDGPFAQIDGQSALPWDAAQAVPALAEIWSEPSADVEQQLIRNLRQLAKTP
jgi:TatD DNase family protein